MYGYIYIHTYICMHACISLYVCIHLLYSVIGICFALIKCYYENILSPNSEPICTSTFFFLEKYLKSHKFATPNGNISKSFLVDIHVHYHLMYVYICEITNSNFIRVQPQNDYKTVDCMIIIIVIVTTVSQFSLINYFSHA